MALEKVRAWIQAWRRSEKPEVTAELVDAIEELADQGEAVTGRQEQDQAKTSADLEKLKNDVGRVRDPKATETVFPGSFRSPGRRR